MKKEREFVSIGFKFLLMIYILMLISAISVGMISYMNFSSGTMTTSNIIIGGFAVSLLLLLVAFLLYRKIILYPINKLKEVAYQLAQGDTDFEYLPRSNDEIGQLMVLFNDVRQNMIDFTKNARMIAEGDITEFIPKSEKDRLTKNMNLISTNLRTMRTEANRASEESVYGSFFHKADGSTLTGIYNEVIENINDIFSSVVNIFDSLELSIVIVDTDQNTKFLNKKVMYGNVDKKRREELVKAKCHNAFNCNVEADCKLAACVSTGSIQAFDTIDTFLNTELYTEIIPLKNKYGDIIGVVEASHDVSKFKNTEKIDKKQLEYQKYEIQKLIDNLNNLANGDLSIISDVSDPDEQTKEIAKDFIRLNQSLIKISTNLRTMHTESKMASEAAIYGSFFHKADISTLAGIYNEIIENINDIFYSIAYVLDSLDFSVVIIDKDYNTKFLNKKVFGGNIDEKRRQELIGTKCHDVFGCDISSPCRMANCISTGMIISYEDTAMLSGAELDIDFIPLKNKQGDIIGIIEASADITKLKELEKIAMKQLEYQKYEILNLVDNVSNLANGNLNIRSNVSDSDEHTKEIAENFIRLNNSLMESTDFIKSIIVEVSDILSQMADKNISMGIEREYVGDFKALKDSINFIVEQFNTIFLEINTAAEQVGVGADQVAGSSQNLSQGASVQASSVQQISATVTEVAEQTKHNAINANNANELSVKAKLDAQKGNEQMVKMLASMQEINDASKNIGSVIKVIDDIAFQTNILALNAAVEAARAGQHGKGFAVVAEEVRNLAARSSKAAKETTDMIDNSISKIEEGYQMANDTANALNKIVTEVSDAVEIVGLIAEASVKQVAVIEQINVGVNQISAVTQATTATAEETAAASEEMAGQAQMLKGLINQFKLKGEDSQLYFIESSTRRIEAPIKKPSNIERSFDDDSFGKY